MFRRKEHNMPPVQTAKKGSPEKALTSAPPSGGISAAFGRVAAWFAVDSKPVESKPVESKAVTFRSQEVVPFNPTVKHAQEFEVLDSKGDSLLIAKLKNHSLEARQEIAVFQPRLEMRDALGDTALLVAAEMIPHISIHYFALLLHYGADYTATNSHTKKNIFHITTSRVMGEGLHSSNIQRKKCHAFFTFLQYEQKHNSDFSPSAIKKMLEAKDINGNTPLHLVVKEGLYESDEENVDFLHDLLKFYNLFGADLNIRNNAGFTPLACLIYTPPSATWDGYFSGPDTNERIKLFAKAGASFSTKSVIIRKKEKPQYMSILDLAEAARPKKKEKLSNEQAEADIVKISLIKQLVREHEKKLAANGLEYTAKALEHCSEADTDVEMTVKHRAKTVETETDIEMELEHKGEKRNKEGFTPFLEACADKNTTPGSVVAKLLEEIDIFAINPITHQNVLHCVIDFDNKNQLEKFHLILTFLQRLPRDHYHKIKTLLESKDYNGNTPLHLTIDTTWGTAVTACKALTDLAVESNANLDIFNNQGYSPLTLASTGMGLYQADLVNILIAAGADCYTKKVVVYTDKIKCLKSPFELFDGHDRNELKSFHREIEAPKHEKNQERKKLQDETAKLPRLIHLEAEKIKYNEQMGMRSTGLRIKPGDYMPVNMSTQRAELYELTYDKAGRLFSLKGPDEELTIAMLEAPRNTADQLGLVVFKSGDDTPQNGLGEREPAAGQKRAFGLFDGASQELAAKRAKISGPQGKEEKKLESKTFGS